MRLVLSVLVWALACIVTLHGCGASPKHTITVRTMPAGGSFTGVWFSPEYGEMHIEQSGSTAIGRYEKDERHGRIQGSVEGDVMRFEWTETRELIVGRPVQTRGHGYFRIAKNDAEDTWNLQGEWGTDAAETGGGRWTAVKSKTRKPDVSGNAANADSESDSSSYDSENTESSGPDDLSDL